MRPLHLCAAICAIMLLQPAIHTPIAQTNRTSPHFVTLNGGRLFYDEAGRGCPVVLIGGGGGMDVRQWDEQLAFLRSQYRVIRFEPRSSGKSDAASAPYSNADDLRAVLDAAGVKQAALVGVSLGGAIALEFALTYPDRISRLVLAAPLVQGFQMSEAQRQRVAGFAKASEAGVEAAVKAFFDDPHFMPAPHNPRARERAKALMRENARPSAPAQPRPLDPPVNDRLSQINAPTLLILSELDHPDLHRRVDHVHKTMRNATKVVLPAAGHMSNLQNPRGFNGALAKFLSGLKCGA